MPGEDTDDTDDVLVGLMACLDKCRADEMAVRVADRRRRRRELRGAAPDAPREEVPVDAAPAGGV